MRDLSKLRHDVISNLSALENSVLIVKENWEQDVELIKRMLPLMADKINQLSNEIAKLDHSKH